MTESTGSQPENTGGSGRTAPIPAAAAEPAGQPTPQDKPTKSGPSKKLLVAGIVFGLIGLGGVSFTAGYWTGHEGGGDHRGKVAEQGFGKHQGQGVRPGPGQGRSEHRRDGAQRPSNERQQPSAPSSAAPSSPSPTPNA